MLSISEIIRPPEIFMYVHENTQIVRTLLWMKKNIYLGTVYLKRKQTAYVVRTIKNIKTTIKHPINAPKPPRGTLQVLLDRHVAFYNLTIDFHLNWWTHNVTPSN